MRKSRIFLILFFIAAGSAAGAHRGAPAAAGCILSGAATGAAMTCDTMLGDTIVRPATPAPGDPTVTDSTVFPIPGKEAFLNAVFHTVVDSSFSAWYLCEEAHPCSFVKYDYDEWIKYALQEDIPIYTLNELAKKSYYDRKPSYWQQLQLIGARCIPEEKAAMILNPIAGLPADTTLAGRRQKRLWRRLWKHWSDLPPQERTVFYFSRPLFTDDGRYAILDLDYRCDPRQCGAGTTCIFRNTGSGWKLVGRRVRWGG